MPRDCKVCDMPAMQCSGVTTGPPIPHEKIMSEISRDAREADLQLMRPAPSPSIHFPAPAKS